MNLFRLDASILPASSASRSLADLVEAEWPPSHPASRVARRDLAAEPVPATAWADVVTSGFVDDAQRTDRQTRPAPWRPSFADEMIEADALVFAVPLYNYGVSQHFKTWFDLAYTDPRIDPTGHGPARQAGHARHRARRQLLPRLAQRRAGTTRPRGCAACSRTSGVSTCASCSAPSRSWASTPRSTPSPTPPASSRRMPRNAARVPTVADPPTLRDRP